MTQTAKRRSRRGATAVEVAIVLGLVFVFLFGIFEYGRYLMVLNLAEYATREGARFASPQFTANKTQAELDTIADEVKQATKDAMGGQDKQIDGFLVTFVRLNPTTGADEGAWSSAKFGEPMAVRITGTYRPIVSLVFPASVPIRVQSSVSSEAN